MIALSGELLAGWWSHVRAYRARYGAAFLALLAVCAITVPNDKAWVEWISADRTEPVLTFARLLSRWGDFGGTLVLAATLVCWGALTRDTRWARAACATVLAAMLAGASVNVLRFSLGRPRPVSSLPDGFYGPSFDFKLHGFPSAHAGTAVATASTLLSASPLLGVPVAIVTGGILWSRMHRRRHHPTDVVVGGFVGALFGIGLGFSARRSSS